MPRRIDPAGRNPGQGSGSNVSRALQLGYFILQFQLLALYGRDLSVRRGGVRQGFRELGFKRRMLCEKITEGW
jgi:hypothetical protein